VYTTTAFIAPTEKRSEQRPINRNDFWCARLFVYVYTCNAVRGIFIRRTCTPHASRPCAHTYEKTTADLSKSISSRPTRTRSTRMSVLKQKRVRRARDVYTRLLSRIRSIQLLRPFHRHVEIR